jgi:hypothetical protein
MPGQRLPGWIVTIKAHKIDRWTVPRQRVQVSALSEQRAVAEAVRMASAAAGLPAWRPYRLELAEHAKAKPAAPETKRRQLRKIAA